jgi:trigger factor
MSLVSNFKIHPTRASFDIVVAKDEYLALVDKYQNLYLKDIKVDGFRPGMVPKEIAMKQINPATLQSKVMEDVIKDTSFEAFGEIETMLNEQNRVILSIAYDDNSEKSIKHDDESNLVYGCIAHLLPAIDLDKIEKIKVKVDLDSEEFPKLEEYTKSQIRTLMKDANDYQTTKEAAKEGDKVEMSFIGSLDGETYPELASDRYTLLLGSNEFLPDFESAMYGVKKDESKTFDVRFPSDYFSDKFAGQTVQFTAEVKDVHVPKYSTLTEMIESSEEMKQDLESEENINKMIKMRYDEEFQQFQESKKQSAVIDALVYQTPNFDIDVDLVGQQTDRIFNNLIEYSSKTNKSIGKAFVDKGLRSEKKNIEVLDALAIKQEIEINVKAELKLQYIYITVSKVKKLDLPSAEELEVYASQISSSPKMYGYPENLTKEELIDMIGDNLANRKALDYLISKMTD